MNRITSYNVCYTKLLRQFKNKTFGVSSNERMSLKELATLFEEATGNILNIKWGGRPYREREVMVPWENAEPVPGWRLV